MRKITNAKLTIGRVLWNAAAAAILFAGCDEKKSSDSGGGSADPGLLAPAVQPDADEISGAGRSVASILLPVSLQNLPAKTSNAQALAVRVVGNNLKYFSHVVVHGADTCDGAAYGAPAGPDTVISDDLQSDGPKVLCVMATGTDANGKMQVAPFQYTWAKDTAAPALALQAPAGFGPYAAGGSEFVFSLNVTDSGVGVYRAFASIRNDASQLCLNANKSAFDANCPVWLQATDTGAAGVFTVAVDETRFSAGTRYQVALRAEDKAQNTATLSDTWSGVWDTVPPSAPTGLGAASSGRQVSLSWSAASGADGYLVLYKKSGSVTHVPVSGSAYSAGTALENGQIVAGKTSALTMVVNGLEAFANHQFKVFAYDAAGNIETSGGTINAQPGDINEFRGLTNAFVWGPGRRIGFEWQPFADSQTSYADMTYGVFQASSTATQDFNGAAQQSITNASWMRYIDNGTAESIFAVVRSARPSGQQDLNQKEARLRFGSGYHHKIAASGRVFGADPLSQAFLRGAQAVELDAWGNVLFSAGAGTVNVLCRETSQAYYCLGRVSGRTHTIAGRDGIDDGEDELLASMAPIGDVQAIAADGWGNIYLADTTYLRIRAVCYNPLAPGFCNARKQAYMYRIAGTGVAGDGANNQPAGSAAIGTVFAMDADSAGNLVVGDSQYFRLRLVCNQADGLCSGRTAGNTYNIAGTGVMGDAADDVLPASVAIGGHRGIKVTGSGNIYLADFDYRRVRALCYNVSASGEFCNGKTSGKLFRVMGTGVSADGANAVAAAGTALGQSYGLDVHAGNIYVSDSTYRRVRVLCYNTTTAGFCSGRTVGHTYWVAGTGAAAADGANASISLSITYGDIRGLALTTEGNAVFADSTYRRLRLHCANAAASSICDGRLDDYHYHLVGTGASAGGWQGAALTMPVGTPTGSAVDALGNVWFADSTTYLVRVICYNVAAGGYCQGKSAGSSYIVAGTGAAGDGADGLAIGAAMGLPVGIAVNGDGNVFIADSGYRRIRAICINTAVSGFCSGKTAGYMYRFVGSSVAGDTADNVVASSATGTPGGIDFDAAGNLFVADNEYRRVRVICQTTSGFCAGKTIGNTYRLTPVNTLADGTDGQALASMTMGAPVSIALDASGNVFLGDGGYNRVRAICLNTAAGYCATKAVNTAYRVTGTGTAGDGSNDVAATTAAIGAPFGIAFDLNGNVLVADNTYRRVRLICIENVATSPCLGQTVGNSFRYLGNGAATGDPASGYHGANIRLDSPARDALTINAAGDLIYVGSSGSVRLFMK